MVEYFPPPTSHGPVLTWSTLPVVFFLPCSEKNFGKEHSKICSNFGEKGPKGLFMATNLGLACALEIVFLALPCVTKGHNVGVYTTAKFAIIFV